jgi:CxxC motif-containing protein (DUF1111 family)
MRRAAGVKKSTLTLAAVGIALIVGASVVTTQQAGAPLDPNTRDQNRRTRFTPTSTTVNPEANAAPTGPTEAPAGFDNLTNGFDPQGPPYDSITEQTEVALRSFNDNRFIFEEVDRVANGLGPTYNAQSCRECHQNVVTGGASQVAEQRTGHLSNGTFFESQGGSLIQSRATDPRATELVAVGDNIRTFRISTNTLGLGFVEAIADNTLAAIQKGQPNGMKGTSPVVPVLEASGSPRLGRFGWKAQHASLESFAADAYLNEVGITSPLMPDENTISGADPSPYDPVADPEDDGTDVKAFANFMRATKVPPRGPITATVSAGARVFTQTGCANCHVATIVTAPAGTPINGGTLNVSAALGNKIIHPYSDFMLHDIGSGDGIPIQPTAQFAPTANQIRTAPLWGLRTRNRLMHDGLSFTRQDAILRHAGQATAVTAKYKALSSSDQAALIAFLNSL